MIHMECFTTELVVYYFQWTVDSNSIMAASTLQRERFLQTSLSEVTRRSASRRSPALTRRVTPEGVLASGRTFRLALLSRR